MNKTERKERLKDIVEMAKDTIENLESKKYWFQKTVHKIENISEHLEDEEYEGFDKDEFIQEIANHLFDRELHDVYHAADDVWNDMVEYAEDLSETKQEQFYEKYDDMETVVNTFNQDYQEYETIEETVDGINEAIELIKAMC